MVLDMYLDKDCKTNKHKKSGREILGLSQTSL